MKMLEVEKKNREEELKRLEDLEKQIAKDKEEEIKRAREFSQKETEAQKLKDAEI